MSWNNADFPGCDRFAEPPIRRHRRVRPPGAAFEQMIRESLDKWDLKLEREAAAAGFGNNVCDYLENKYGADHA